MCTLAHVFEAAGLTTVVLASAPDTLLDTYPLTIESDETPLACDLPPRFDATLAPAVDEAPGTAWPAV